MNYTQIDSLSETETTSDDFLDLLIISDRLIISEVPTSDVVALAKRRRGQARLRKLMLGIYEIRCALCDVTDKDLLIASHIAGWAEMPDAQGKLSNVICLCRFHDALFEAGYWSLTDGLQVILNESKLPAGSTIDLLLSEVAFRRPSSHPPDSEYLAHHRDNHGF